MPDNSSSLYLDLLKKSLTGYLYIDNEYLNAIPSELWWRKSWLKTLRNRLIVGLLKKSGMMVLRKDKRTANERREARQEGLDWTYFAETMVGLARLDNLQYVIGEIVKDNVPGDLIETGVWRGGASIFMKAVLKTHGVTNRKLWLCDSFEGLPPPNPDKYPDDIGDVTHTFDMLAVSQEQVEANFERYDLFDDQIQFVKGYFEDTLPNLEIGKLALLRLDGDMYGSTMITLESLYDKVSVGGFIVVDDYALGPCRKAVLDFRKSKEIDDEIIAIDRVAVYWRKSR